MKENNGQPRQIVRRLILIALRQPSEVSRLAIADLDLLVRLMRRVRLTGRLAADLVQHDRMSEIPQNARDVLEGALVMATARERVAMWELNRIGWALRDQEGLDLICMKGCAYLLANLPNTKGRFFADVDILVDEEQLDRLERLLNRRGWRTKELSPYDDNYYRRWTHELPPIVHRERDVEIDLHHNILPRTARLNPPSDKLVAAANEVEGWRFKILCDEDLVIHAMVHLMFDGDLADSLRDLVDIDDLNRHFGHDNDEYWRGLLSRAEELRVGRPVYYALRYCRDLLASPIPQCVIDASRKWRPIAPVQWLMDRLVPLAIFPPHPDQSQATTHIARLLLYVRSHWLRMPPWLLAMHLTYKFVMKRFYRPPAGG